MSDLNLQLQQGLKELNLTATEAQQQKLIILLEQLVKWNKTYNLTAIKSAKEGLVLHLLDSLAVIPFISQPTLLDVGTGAGFPGLPLAIMLPKVQFTLLDSNSKKIRFIRQQIHLLGLDNVEVVDSRVEDFNGCTFDGIISRAFASLEDMVSLTRHLVSENGCWLAMKGQQDSTVTSLFNGEIEQTAFYPLVIPGLDAQRCLIELRYSNNQ